MEQIRTKVHVQEMFKEIKARAPWAYETLEDFVDEALRRNYERILECITSRARVLSSRT